MPPTPIVNSVPRTRGGQRGPVTLDALTGLRGLAALVVFVSHSANEGLLPSWLGQGFGQLGVLLFFLLSGFLMGYLYLDRPATQQAIAGFARARVARVVPLYLACVCASVLISSAIDPAFHYDFRDPELALRALLFIDAPFEFWTIPVEFQFYAAFLALWWCWQRTPHHGWLVAFAGIFAALAVAQALLIPIEARLFPRYSPAFFAGVATASTLAWWRCQAERRWFVALSWLAPAAFALNLPGLRQQLGLTFSDDFFWRTWGDPINWLTVYAFFLCAVLDLKSVRFLNHRLLAFLGTISFGFYLFHYPLIEYGKLLAIPTLARFAIAFAVTIWLAHLSFRRFETPVGEWLRRRWTDRRTMAAELTP